MVSDEILQRDVLAELEREPSLNAVHIGVAAKDGVVTLTGHVASFEQQHAAERTARRVRGVKAIAQEIEVRLPPGKKHGDDKNDRIILTATRYCRLCTPRIIAALALGGLVLVLVGVRAARQPIWPPDFAYERAWDRAMGAQLGELVALAAAYLGAAFIVLAAVLLGYRLARSIYQRHRGAH